MRSQDFIDKVALITGSGQGIGKAIAAEFVGLGTKVVINGRNAERLDVAKAELEELGGDVLPIVADITVQEQIEHLIDETIRHFGRLDFLINNAGISMRGKLADLHPDVIRTVFEINVCGTANLTILALPFIRKAQGSVIFISSVAGIRGIPLVSAYGASKMALRGLAETLRIEEADSGIHVGLIYVGFTEIEFNKQTLGADGKYTQLSDRSGFKVQSKESVASAVIRNIKKRNFVTTLSAIGKLNSILQSIAPGLVERILIRSSNKIEERS